MGVSFLARRLYRACQRAGHAIEGVSIGDEARKETWTVQPPSWQPACQPVIDAFDPDDPAHEQAELESQVTATLDTERLTAAVVWVILRQMYPLDTEAQTNTKFGVARTRIINAFTAQPWK